MRKTEPYEFTLVLTGVDDQTVHLEDQLFEAGCDDALINFRNGTVYLDFQREAGSLEEAVISAIRAIESSEVGARIISVLPDNVVSEADIAKRLEKGRQIVSLWTKRERRASKPFPDPILKLSDKSPMWRWYDVVQWLFQQRLINDQDIVETAKFIENINAVLDERDASIRNYRQHILNELIQNKESGVNKNNDNRMQVS